MSKLRQMMSEDFTEYPMCKEVLSGMSTEKMDNCVEYLQRQFRENINNPKGLKFIKLEMIDPIDAAKKVTTKNSHSYDISRTDFALAYMYYEYKGVPLQPLPLYVPVMGPIMYIAGSPYFLRMVLSDKLLSPGEGDIFERVYRGKAKISRADRGVCNMHVMEGTEIKKFRINGDVLTCNYFKPTIPANLKITKCETTLVLYLLTKFGYEKTMEMVLGHVPALTDVPDPTAVDPREDIVFTTSNTAELLPKTKHLIGKEGTVKITNVGFRVNREVYKKLDKTGVDRLTNMMCTMFYILDGLPYLTLEHVDNKEAWIIPFSDTLYGKNNDDQIKALSAKSHLEGLSNYVTGVVLSDIDKEFGGTLGQDFTTDGFFKLMVVLIHNYDEWRASAALVSAAVTDKRLRLYYYMFVDIITQMNVLNMLMSSAKNQNLDVNGVLKVIRGELNIGRMYRMKGGGGKQGPSKPNQAVKPLASYSGDHKYFKVTSDLELQVNISGAMSKRPGGGGSESGDPTTLLDSGQCVGGTPNVITKSRLAANRYVNCFLPYDSETETIRYDDQIRADLAHLDDVLSRTSHRPKNIKMPKHFNIYNDI